MSDITTQIMAASTAGDGFRLVAFHYPVSPGWSDDLLGGAPRDYKRKSMLDVTMDSFGTMVFQQVDVPASPLETKVVSSEMSFEYYFEMSFNLTNLRG